MRQCLSLFLYGIIAKFPYGKLRINSIFICTFAVVMHRRLMAEVLNGKDKWHELQQAFAKNR